jgi:hypothetical protein
VEPEKKTIAQIRWLTKSAELSLDRPCLSSMSMVDWLFEIAESLISSLVQCSGALKEANAKSLEVLQLGEQG